VSHPSESARRPHRVSLADQPIQLATGFQAMAKDDRDNMVKQFPAYDALYAYCRSMADRGPR